MWAINVGDPKVCAQLFFFFSSRRRHTRSLCDWSSDVCSSDLDEWEFDRVEPILRAFASEGKADQAYRPLLVAASADRSEERRVGKECRSRWSPYHYKKKRDVMAEQNSIKNGMVLA